MIHYYHVCDYVIYINNITNVLCFIKFCYHFFWLAIRIQLCFVHFIFLLCNMIVYRKIILVLVWYNIIGIKILFGGIVSLWARLDTFLSVEEMLLLNINNKNKHMQYISLRQHKEIQFICIRWFSNTNNDWWCQQLLQWHKQSACCGIDGCIVEMPSVVQLKAI